MKKEKKITVDPKFKSGSCQLDEKYEWNSKMIPNWSFFTKSLIKNLNADASYKNSKKFCTST